MPPHPTLLGKYQTPPFHYGDAACCEARGEVIITGLSNAPIPWPIGKRPASRGRALVLFGHLVKAVRRESVAAVAFHWSVSDQTVTKWRKSLGVGAMTEGTTRLKSVSA